MNSEPGKEPPHFAIWRGRKGLLNTVACLVLAVPCALFLSFLVERNTVAPTCRAYGQPLGLVYLGIEHYTNSDDNRTVCIFLQPNGSKIEVPFAKFVSFFSDLWVGFTVDLKFTLPAFIVLLALVRI